MNFFGIFLILSYKNSVYRLYSFIMSAFKEAEKLFKFLEGDFEYEI